MKELSLKTVGLTVGCVWAISVFSLGVLAGSLDWAKRWLETFSTVYIGYKETFLGLVVGASWGLLDGFITGVLIAWVFNKF